MSHRIALDKGATPRIPRTFAAVTNGQSQASGTKLDFDTPSPLEGWTFSFSVFTCTKAGWWLVTGGIFHTATVTGQVKAIINSTEFTPSRVQDYYNFGPLFFAAIYFFAVGDTLEIRSTNSPTPITLAANSNSFIDMLWLGV